MSPLRERMIEDMTLAGLALGTRQAYTEAVRRLAVHYRRSPDQLSEEGPSRFSTSWPPYGDPSQPALAVPQPVRGWAAQPTRAVAYLRRRRRQGGHSQRGDVPRASTFLRDTIDTTGHPSCRATATACDPTQEPADHIETSPSALANQAVSHETCRVALDKLPVRPAPETPEQPTSARILFAFHLPVLRC